MTTLQAGQLTEDVCCSGYVTSLAGMGMADLATASYKTKKRIHSHTFYLTVLQSVVYSILIKVCVSSLKLNITRMHESININRINHFLQKTNNVVIIPIILP